MSHKQAQTILYRHNTLTVTPAYTLTRDAITLMSYTCRMSNCQEKIVKRQPCLGFR
jgi:hypothetical protein